MDGQSSPLPSYYPDHPRRLYLGLGLCLVGLALAFLLLENVRQPFQLDAGFAFVHLGLGIACFVAAIQKRGPSRGFLLTCAGVAGVALAQMEPWIYPRLMPGAQESGAFEFAQSLLSILSFSSLALLLAATFVLWKNPDLVRVTRLILMLSIAVPVLAAASYGIELAQGRNVFLFLGDQTQSLLQVLVAVVTFGIDLLRLLLAVHLCKNTRTRPAMAHFAFLLTVAPYGVVLLDVLAQIFFAGAPLSSFGASFAAHLALAYYLPAAVIATAAFERLASDRRVGEDRSEDAP